MENLVKVGEDLLKKPVTRVNLGTGLLEQDQQDGYKRVFTTIFPNYMAEEEK